MSEQTPNSSRDPGFSILELLIMLLVLVILAVVASRFINPALYYADKEANTVMNVLKEAQQNAASQSETIRVEIDRLDRTIRMIDENDPSDASDDKEILKQHIGNPGSVVFDTAPTNVANLPNEVTPVPTLEFKPSHHPSSSPREVATLRFLKNGKVTDAGINAEGKGAVVQGATIFFWTPMETGDAKPSKKASLIRALTVLGSTGKTRYWKCAVVQGQCTDWIR